MASELESDLRNTVEWVRKWLVDFNTGKTQVVSFVQPKNTGVIDMKMDGSVCEEKSSFKILGLTFLSILDCGPYIISIAKSTSKKTGALILSIKFCSPEVALYLNKSTIWPCMKSVVMSELVLLVATWNCWISHKSGYAGQLVLYLLPLLNP